MPLWKVRQYCSQGMIPHAYLSLPGTVSEPFATHSKKAILLTLISLPLPVISLLDGHSLVKVLCGTKLPIAIIIADYP